MTEFENQLEKWGKKVAERCGKYARENDGLDFYVFQSEKPKKENPDLLILGLNPGGCRTYNEQVEKYRRGKYRETLDDLCQGYNLYVYTDNNKITIARTLSKIFSKEKMKNILKESIAMNLYYFNTKDGKDLREEDEDILKFCKGQSFNVIKLINPKNILTLGSENPLGANEEILMGLLWRGEYEGVPVYRIKHPSACWSDLDCALVGEVIEKLLDMRATKDLSSFIQKAKEKYKNYRFLKKEIILGKIISLLKQFKEELSAYEEKKDVMRFSFANDILQITFHNDKKPYLAIRHKEFGKEYQEKHCSYEFEDEFREVLIDENFEATNVWLGRKFIDDYAEQVGEYSSVSNSTMALAIALDVMRVVTLCNKVVV